MSTPITITTRTWLKVGLVYPFLPIVFPYGLNFEMKIVLGEMIKPLFFMSAYAVIAIVVFYKYRKRTRGQLNQLFWRMPLYVMVVYGGVSAVFLTIYFETPSTMSPIYFFVRAIGICFSIAGGVAVVFSSVFWLITKFLECVVRVHIVSPMIDTPLSAPTDTTHSQ